MILLIVFAGGAVYVSDYYHASDYVSSYLSGSDQVQVKTINQGLLLDGPGEDTAMIFYPGGKVEYTAYVPLLFSLAEEGADCFLVNMPLNIAFLGINKAGGIIEEYTYQKWIIGGHSLGGVAAAMYAADHELDGLILLASYPTKEVEERTLELYGDHDGVLNMTKREEGDQYLSEESKVVIIEGGTHAWFGDYGEQKGDGTAGISREEQQEITVENIKNFLENNRE